MKTRTVWGLASAGNVSRSFLGRLPALKRHIGPVFSTSYRLASRISNSLRAGTPVRTAPELQPSDPILICMPGGSIDELVSTAFLNAIDWSGKRVLLCDGFDHVPIAPDFRARGAAVAILATVPGGSDLYVVSGDRPAISLAKATVHSLGAVALEVASDRLTLFQAAITLTGSLFTPLIETAVQCLRQSGLEQPVAERTAEALLQQSLRGFKRAGRRSWSGPIAVADHGAVNSQFAALEAFRPAMARYFHDAVQSGFELFQTYPELTRYDRARLRQFRKGQSS